MSLSRGSAQSFGSLATRIPTTTPGMRVGLFGGSFNPPHAAHRQLSDHALRRLALDQIWWLVTPGNPLKTHDALAPLADRMTTVRALTSDNRRIKVLDLEKTLTTNTSSNTISFVQRRAPCVKFVWLMGSDNMQNFHRWHRWEHIVERLPIAVFARPGSTLFALSSPLAIKYARYRITPRAAHHLPDAPAPAWTLLQMPWSPLSSTALRNLS